MGNLPHGDAEIKVAATNAAAQQLLQVDAPFFGRLLSNSTFSSPAVLRSGEFTVRCVEAEFGHPLNVVAWLASELPRHGRYLRCGDRVTTGTAATVYFANPGDHVIADFGSFGRVELDWSV